MSHLTLSTLRQRFVKTSPEVAIDHLVIGGGVVGLSITHYLTRHFPHKSTYLVERHNKVGQETSSRNSEVIHAGLYYPLNSLKTRLCLRGRHLLYDFCRNHSIPHQKVGKLIISKSLPEVEYLKSLYHKAQTINANPDLGRQVPTGDANGTSPILPIEFLNRSQALNLEPDLNHEIAACLLSPETGIVDSHALLTALESLIVESENGEMVLGTSVVRIDKAESKSGWIVQTNTASQHGVDEAHSVLAKCVINCAGLNAHNMYNQIIFDQSRQLRLSFCKGNYYAYASKRGVQSVRHLIYPTPSFRSDQKGFAGLGTHLTLDLNHKIKFGPDVEWLKTRTIANVRGSFRHGDQQTNQRTVEEEVQDFWEAHLAPNDSRMDAICASVRAYLPQVEPEHFTSDYSGIRPKLKGLDEEQNFINRAILGHDPLQSTDDTLEDFFINQSDHGFVNLLGIESPGLTSSLAIAEYVADLLRKDFWGLDSNRKGKLRDRRVSELGQLEAWE
ncbi:hypothetical protein CROQUDRAFT_42746 [Cronartium quercuum f. sp. fusiforme G11]|uniref:L-2-hydroxyglutarate dehydrogenase, mitochondrial n=1 Tax=Cronartium quercuum f. sp. fusiforme G11 TaxID=708437 RepID=A0A9P6NK90_9BASI|nr:hypothetical protein CROQUDRAFT_42746 [Cronartium quercuum f. sp. fusiforme G11]